MLIEREEFAAILLRPGVALIDHHADVRVAAAEIVGLAVAAVAPAFGGVVVIMIRDGVEPFIDAGVLALAERFLQMRAGHEVPEVSVHGVDEEHLSVRIPVVAPGIRGTVAEHFHHYALRVVAPDAAIERNAEIVRRAGRAETAGTRMPAATVEPAIRPPAQTVGEVVIVVLRHGEAVEHHLRRTVGKVVAIRIRHEEQLRRAHEPHAAAPDFHTGEHLHGVGENFARVGAAIVVFVLKDEHAVAMREIEAHLVLGISKILRHPHAPARVPRHGDGILHLRLGSEDIHTKAGRHFHLRGGLLGGHERLAEIGFRIAQGREVIRRGEGGEEQEDQVSHGGEKRGFPAGARNFLRCVRKRMLSRREFIRPAPIGGQRRGRCPHGQAVEHALKESGRGKARGREYLLPRRRAV